MNYSSKVTKKAWSWLYRRWRNAEPLWFTVSRP